MKTLTLLVEMRCNAYCIFCGQRAVDSAVEARRTLNGFEPKPRVDPRIPLAEQRGMGSRGVQTDSPRLTLAEAKQAIEKGRADGYDSLHLQGGEPTLWEPISELVSHARSIGYAEVVMVTNGLRMAKPEFAAKILAAGLTGVIFSLVGPDAAVHDSITLVEGSFDRLMQALDNVHDAASPKLPKPTINANVIVHGQSASRAPEIARLLGERGVQSATFHLYRPEYFGADPKVKNMLMFPLDGLAQYLTEARSEGREVGLSVNTADIPLCLGRQFSRDNIQHWAKLRARSRHKYVGPGLGYEAKRPWKGEQPAMRTPDPRFEGCASCIFNEGCSRVPTDFLEISSSNALEPVGTKELLDFLENLEAGEAQLVDAEVMVSMLAQESVFSVAELATAQATLTGAWARRLEAVNDAGSLAETNAFLGWIGLRPKRSAGGPRQRRVDLDALVATARSSSPPTLRLKLGAGHELSLRGQREPDGVLRLTDFRALTPSSGDPDLAERRALMVDCVVASVVGAQRLRVTPQRLEVQRGGRWDIGLVALPGRDMRVEWAD